MTPTAINTPRNLSEAALLTARNLGVLVCIWLTGLATLFAVHFLADHYETGLVQATGILSLFTAPLCLVYAVCTSNIFGGRTLTDSLLVGLGYAVIVPLLCVPFILGVNAVAGGIGNYADYATAWTLIALALSAIFFSVRFIQGVTR